MLPKMEMDSYDRKILNLLGKDGRMTWRDLSEAIGLSLTPTVRRVRMLEEAGYIAGYHARLDEQRLFGSMIVFIQITLERQVRTVLDSFEKRVASLPEVTAGYLMSGAADYLLRAVVRDLDHYRQLLDRLTEAEGVAHIQSSFSLKEFANKPVPEIS